MNPICGAVTPAGFGPERQRCTLHVEHRGPHYTVVEPISCDCKHFCHCPEETW